MEDKSSGDETCISSPDEPYVNKHEAGDPEKKNIEVHRTMKIIDRAKENVSVRITTS
jgi:hypothetical protein